MDRKKESLSFKQIILEALKPQTFFYSSSDLGEELDGQFKTHPDLLVSSKVSSTWVPLTMEASLLCPSNMFLRSPATLSCLLRQRDVWGGINEEGREAAGEKPSTSGSLQCCIVKFQWGSCWRSSRALGGRWRSTQSVICDATSTQSSSFATFHQRQKNTFAFLNLKFDVDLGSKPLCVLTTPEQPIAGRPPCSPASDWPGLD